MPQCVHLDEGRQSGNITEVVGIRPLGQGGAAGRLDADDAQVLLLPCDLILDKGQEHAGEIGAAADAADDDIRVEAGHLHLLHGFLADDGLVQQDMVEHAAQRVVWYHRG